MANVPDEIANSGLYKRLSVDEDLNTVFKSVRRVVYALAETTNRSVPDFTDHTIRHMDALWGVADKILTADECQQMTPAEAFLLGVGFYLHDIGMAYAATEVAIAELRASRPYRAFLAQLPEADRRSPRSEARALAFAVRVRHADAAMRLALNEIPGTKGRYIFEALSVREEWGAICGELASSHHWDLSRLELTYGPQRDVPLPGNRSGDLLFVASCLRIIDYAHINRDRAVSIDRELRPTLNAESLTHWLAQEHIDGPQRSANELVYRSARAISDVDAWWLYYEMLTGLDLEIRSVKRMLDGGRDDLKRLSIAGVRGASSPGEAAVLIKPDGFLPIEVSLRTGSIERLVELLAGETLYGRNPMAAVRELIQNARDAIMLKAAVATSEAERVTLAIPIRITLNTTSEPPTLEVVDHGIGMSRKVITDYLVSIASDYWSTQFANDFPEIAEKGFQTAGKFGIGFLSVFMLGSDVTVESNRVSEERHSLSLRGVGQRGELRRLTSASGSGTAVRVCLRPSVLDRLQPLPDLISVYAPTLPHALTVEVDGTITEIPVGSLQSLTAQDLEEWVLRAVDILEGANTPASRSRGYSPHFFLFRRFRIPREFDENASWPLGQPEYREGSDRLVASFAGVSLLCSRGLTVQAISTPGFVGVIDLPSTTVDVSRSRAVNADFSAILEKAKESILPTIIENLDFLSKTTMMLDKIKFIARCVDYYSRQVILSSDVPWITHLQIPGTMQMIGSNALLAKLAAARTVFVGYNTGGAGATRKWMEASSVLDSQEIGLSIGSGGQAGPGYRSGSERKIVGSLRTVWQSSPESPLFGTLLTLLAQAWQVNVEILLDQADWTHETDEVYGKFHRP